MVGMKDSRLTHPSQSQYPILALIDRFLALIDDRFPALAVPMKISMHEHMYYDDRIAMTYDRLPMLVLTMLAWKALLPIKIS